MNWNEPRAYAVKHKNEEIRAASRSGGAFTALSDCILQDNGVVYGCVLTKEFGAKHIRADSVETRNRMRGSKYIQSDLGDTFQSIREDLRSGRCVLFSGTSCQVAGLKGFLGQEYANLVCMDIVCHGVPSCLVWKEYLKWQEMRNKGNCIQVDFRNKKDYGWKAHIETLMIRSSDGLTRKVDSDIFRRLFYGHNILRPCCYQCPYKSTMHPGDITIADYWGIDQAAPGFNDDKGVSLVLVNNEKGRRLLDRVKTELTVIETKIEDSLQPPLVKPFECPKQRNKFWQDFYEREFAYVAKRYGTVSLPQKLKKRIKKYLVGIK